MAVGLDDGVLRITGDDAGNQVVVTQRHEKVANQAQVRSGVTSVDLDTALLEASANLKLTGANSPGRPVNPSFDVGFPILRTSSFIFQKDPFAPVSGTIEHVGTVTFDAKGTAVTVGDFEIGFDAARATGGRSGFFVRDTAGGLGILFAIGAPDEVSVRHPSLTIRGR